MRTAFATSSSLKPAALLSAFGGALHAQEVIARGVAEPAIGTLTAEIAELRKQAPGPNLARALTPVRNPAPARTQPPVAWNAGLLLSGERLSRLSYNRASALSMVFTEGRRSRRMSAYVR